MNYFGVLDRGSDGEWKTDKSQPENYCSLVLVA